MNVALDAEYRYMISRAKTNEEKRKLVEHAMRFDLDLSDLL